MRIRRIQNDLIWQGQVRESNHAKDYKQFRKGGNGFNSLIWSPVFPLLRIISCPSLHLFMRPTPIICPRDQGGSELTLSPSTGLPQPASNSGQVCPGPSVFQFFYAPQFSCVPYTPVPRPAPFPRTYCDLRP